MKNRAVIVLALGILGLVTAACYDSPANVALATGASSFDAQVNFSPTAIPLTPLAGTRCAFGTPFATSFNLIVTAGIHDLTMDSVTLHLIDGTNVGGPSVTIPSLELGTQPGSLFVRAGTTRDFPLHANFGCFSARPHGLRGNVLLFDGHGLRHTMTIESTIQ